MIVLSENILLPVYTQFIGVYLCGCLTVRWERLKAICGLSAICACAGISSATIGFVWFLLIIISSSLSLSSSLLSDSFWLMVSILFCCSASSVSEFSICYLIALRFLIIGIFSVKHGFSLL